ncbi:myo-inositol transporter 1 [Nannizzia gypsea CBS 118893]|uniref:Myo-inositol transporter 1 n=1 Tax=Arthroderma gypseum (strain ATCC MYA-4604 / CBS 118893) TaxID=535722 RepID=E5QYL4_ARTGP|nr:myo-inositol transporter 1 [Nannizzia gypsea CBS 118893]EFQ98877.1 myo-inositol transporter 1 [Nannizzia gypsea CBS 118893]
MARVEEDTLDAAAPLLESPRHDNTSSPNTRDEDDTSVIDVLSLTGTGTWFIWALTFSAGISGFLFGYDTGVISSALVSIGTDLSQRELTILDRSLITSSTSLFALIASPLGGVLGDKAGRKPAIVISGILFIIGALWQGATSTVWGMISGRSLVGLAIGMSSLITPLYISELSPSHLRGRMVTVLSLLVTGGQVIAYIVGWLLSSQPSGWRWMVGLGCSPAVMQLLILAFLPETPRWLVRANRANEARRIMQRVYGDTKESNQIVEHILRDIEQEVLHASAEIDARSGISTSATSLPTRRRWLQKVQRTYTDLFTIGCHRRALIIACTLQGLQQLCGFNSLMYFAATIFKSLSFSSPTLTALSVAGTNFIFTFLAYLLIDRIGRRRILLYSIPVMVVSLVICAIAFPSTSLADGSASEPPAPANSQAAIILLCLTTYTASYASGLGNVPWQQSELFPLSVRSLGSALATGTNWGSNFIIGLTFLPMMRWMGAGWTFFIYAAICGVGWGLLAKGGGSRKVIANL